MEKNEIRLNAGLENYAYANRVSMQVAYDIEKNHTTRIRQEMGKGYENSLKRATSK